MRLPGSREASFPRQHPMAWKPETKGNETGNEIVSTGEHSSFARKTGCAWKRDNPAHRKRTHAFAPALVSFIGGTEL